MADTPTKPPAPAKLRDEASLDLKVPNGGETYDCANILSEFEGSFDPPTSAETTITITFNPIPPTVGGPTPFEFTVPVGTTDWVGSIGSPIPSGSYNITVSAPGYSSETAPNVTFNYQGCEDFARLAPREKSSVALGTTELMVTLHGNIHVDDVLYTVVSLEYFANQKLFAVQADYDVSNGFWRVTFLLVPKGKYIMRAVTFRRSGAPIIVSKSVKV
jgi:hypothetical protein